MSQTTLEARAETLVHEAIDDIADELGISVEGYPDVFYNKNPQEFFSRYSRAWGLPDHKVLSLEAVYMHQRNAIFISSLSHEDIGEEAAHFIHYHHAHIQPRKKQPWDFISFLAVAEAFGFFGSKLFYHRRALSKFYSQVPEIQKDQRNRFAVANSIVLQSKTIIDQPEFVFEWVHNEGYLLGEELYHNYLSGFISAREIRNFFSRPLQKNDEALNAFLQLQYAVLHHNKKP